MHRGKIGKSGRKWDRFYFFTENNQLYYFDENKVKKKNEIKS